MEVTGANGAAGISNITGRGGAVRSAAEMGMVEIVEPHDRAFFKAAVLDAEPGGRKYLVRYLGEDEVLWVDAARVRALPPSRSLDEVMSFDPREGDKVEVSFSEEGEFESW
eukprot:268649-Rhodomonas_salina.2